MIKYIIYINILNYCMYNISYNMTNNVYILSTLCLQLDNIRSTFCLQLSTPYKLPNMSQKRISLVERKI